LLAEGFLAQTLQRLADPAVREYVLQRVAQRFSTARHDV
jgi:DnaB-helicase binding domain of primase